jgi:phosphoenolpyruvate carboxylase
VLAAPAGSVAGRLKLTEQGEVIATRYANPPLALWALEQTVSATILASTAEHDRAVVAAAREGADAMDELATAARAAYRALVWEDPDLEAVFLAATPIERITGLRLGSRPAARGGDGASAAPMPSLASLRAIPWVFAWTQVRANVPAWYGLGTAVDAYVARHGPAGAARLARLHAGWPFFRVLLENAEVALARTDPRIAARHLAVAGAAGVRLAAAIADEHARSVRAVLAISGRAALLDGVPVLQRSIELRTPYLDPLSELQMQALRRLGELPPGAEERAGLERLVGLTISGIAAGVQGTG